MVRAENPQHWRDRAKEVRALAAQMTDEEARSGMLQVAKSYEMIARHAEERMAQHMKHEGSKARAADRESASPLLPRSAGFASRSLKR